MNEQFRRLLARVLGNALVGFSTAYVATTAAGNSDVGIAVVAGLLQAGLAAGKQFKDYGSYNEPKRKAKGQSNLLVF